MLLDIIGGHTVNGANHNNRYRCQEINHVGNNGKEHDRNTQRSKDAFAVIDAFKRQFALMGELAMELDFFTDGGFVLTDRQGDGGLGRSVGNTGKDDMPFFKSEMRKKLDCFIRNTSFSSINQTRKV